MSLYFAAAVARTDDGWVGRELDLEGVEDLDTLTDMLRDVSGEDGGTALLLLEEDDEYVAIVRVDEGLDARVFLSDRRVVDHSEIAAMLYEDIDDVPVEDDDDEGTRPETEPAGDASLLADLGTPPDRLLELCAEEGRLPADVISAVCEKAGCLDTIEELREG